MLSDTADNELQLCTIDQKAMREVSAFKWEDEVKWLRKRLKLANAESLRANQTLGDRRQGRYVTELVQRWELSYLGWFGTVFEKVKIPFLAGTTAREFKDCRLGFCARPTLSAVVSVQPRK